MHAPFQGEMCIRDRIRGFVKNGGGTFDAALTLDDQFKTSFVFEPRDTPRQGKRNKRK